MSENQSSVKSKKLVFPWNYFLRSTGADEIKCILKRLYGVDTDTVRTRIEKTRCVDKIHENNNAGVEYTLKEDLFEFATGMAADPDAMSGEEVKSYVLNMCAKAESCKIKRSTASAGNEEADCPRIGKDDVIGYAMWAAEVLCSDLDAQKSRSTGHRGMIAEARYSDFIPKVKHCSKEYCGIGLYLALEALLHLCYEKGKSSSICQSYSGLLQHFDKKLMGYSQSEDEKYMVDISDINYRSKIFRNYTRNTVISWYLGVPYADEAVHTTFQFPTFLDGLMCYLIESITLNPFHCVKAKTSAFESYKKMVTDSSEMSMDNLFAEFYNDSKGDEFVSRYLAERIMGFNSLFYAADELRKYYEYADRNFSIDRREMLKYIAPIYFVQDCFNSELYTRKLFEILEGKAEFSYLEYLDKDEKNIADIAIAKSKISEDERRLLQCKQYLLFLSTYYLPLLSAVFYVILMDECKRKAEKVNKGKEDADKLDETGIAITLLVGYLSNNRIKEKLEGHRMRFAEAKKPKGEAIEVRAARHQAFDDIFRSVHHECRDMDKWKRLTMLDYTAADNEYQAYLLDTVLRRKMSLEQVAVKTEVSAVEDKNTKKKVKGKTMNEAKSDAEEASQNELLIEI